MSALDNWGNLFGALQASEQEVHEAEQDVKEAEQMANDATMTNAEKQMAKIELAKKKSALAKKKKELAKKKALVAKQRRDFKAAQSREKTAKKAHYKNILSQQRESQKQFEQSYARIKRQQERNSRRNPNNMKAVNYVHGSRPSNSYKPIFERASLKAFRQSMNPMGNRHSQKNKTRRVNRFSFNE